MAIDTATAKAGQARTVTCTVTNTAATAVNVTGIKPLASVEGALPNQVAAVCGDPPIGPGSVVSVAGSSGTRDFSWSVLAHSPPRGGGGGLAMPASQAYDFGATVYCSDGSVTTATPVVLTVTPD